MGERDEVQDRLEGVTAELASALGVIWRRGDAEARTLLALVALDAKRIAYLPPSKAKQTIHIRTHDDRAPPVNGGKSGKTFEGLTFSAALREVLHAA